MQSFYIYYQILHQHSYKHKLNIEKLTNIKNKEIIDDL